MKANKRHIALLIVSKAITEKNNILCVNRKGIVKVTKPGKRTYKGGEESELWNDKNATSYGNKPLIDRINTLLMGNENFMLKCTIFGELLLNTTQVTHMRIQPLKRAKRAKRQRNSISNNISPIYVTEKLDRRNKTYYQPEIPEKVYRPRIPKK